MPERPHARSSTDMSGEFAEPGADPGIPTPPSGREPGAGRAGDLPSGPSWVDDVRPGDSSSGRGPRARRPLDEPDPGSPPVTTLVYGPSRPLVTLLLYALADDANPRFHWLDIRRESEPPATWDPGRLGWLEERRSWVADPVQGLSPDNARANAAIFHVIRSDEPPAVLSRLTDFLRLPPTIQEILGEMPAAGDSNLLAVANVDRISGSIPESALGPILAAFAWLRCALFVGHVGSPGAAAGRFTRVVRIDGSALDLWREARVYFERGDGPDATAGARGLSPEQLPFLERAFKRAAL
jgi:hypothetical protein